MSPTLRVNLDGQSFDDAQQEAAGWIELHEDGQVTEAEAAGMIREIAQDIRVDVEFKP